MEFIVGGYFLVQGTQRKKWMDKNLIPSTFWTVSTYICETFPDSWVLTWGSYPKSRGEKSLQQLLRLSKDDFFAMQAKFDELFNGDRFGFPNVLFSLEQAREFCAQYVQHLPNIKLMSVALPEVYWQEFIEEFTPQGKNIGESGIRKKLRGRELLKGDALFRGFEVLGFDWARFYSFVSNSLETSYHRVLNIRLNSNGLIDTYQDAVRAADYTMRDESGAEPVFWRPWRVSEYPLK